MPSSRTLSLMSLRAFTLVETLAVVVILGAALAAALSAAGGIGGSRDARAAELALRSAAARAQEVSLREGETELALGTRLIVRSLHTETDDQHERVYPLPAGVSITLDDHNSESPGAIRFDAAGRATDALLVARFIRADPTRFELRGVAATLHRLPGSEGDEL